MSEMPRIYVAGVGMITPVGFDAASTEAAVKAGINKYQTSIQINHRRYPITMALVPDEALPPLNDELEKHNGLTARQRRMLRLITPALQEVLGIHAIQGPLPLLLALPENLPGIPEVSWGKFLPSLVKQTKANIDIKNSRTINTGRAGGIQLLELAFRYMTQTGEDFILVGGVDTYLDSMLLGKLDAEERLLSEDVMDGFVPGEASCVLLLASDKGKDRLGIPMLPTLFRPGYGEEVGHRYSQEPYKGDGLANAFSNALSGERQPLVSIYASLNGESLGAKELGVAVIRNKTRFISEYRLDHPADCFGDIGAAFGPVLIGLISKQKQGNYLGYCSSELEHRAAVCVQV